MMNSSGKITITDTTHLFADHTNILGKSNAFPDVIKFEGVDYFAFRSASLHFPTSNSRIIILKRQNNKWHVRAEFKIEKYDVRNPKFYIDNGHLMVVFAVTPSFVRVGKKSMIYGAEKQDDDSWSQPQEVNLPGAVSPYRIGYIDSSPVMSVFNDYLNIFEMNVLPQVQFLTPESTYKWTPFQQFANIHIRGTETDFIELEDKYYFVSRMDFSIDKSAGTKILCFDKKTGQIIEKITRIKLDAPYLFIHCGKILLLARKTLFFKGRYDLLPKWVPDRMKTIMNGMIYWLTPKSLALWEIDKTQLTVKHLLNFPVQGDTGYAVAQKSSDCSYDVYTYSSTWGKYLPWLFGQFGKTDIMKFNLLFSASE
jgi:hypothetical protein